MAHFAKITNDNKVEQVIVIANDDCGDGEFPESEPIGQAFIASLGLTGLWLHIVIVLQVLVLIGCQMLVNTANLRYQLSHLTSNNAMRYGLFALVLMLTACETTRDNTLTVKSRVKNMTLNSCNVPDRCGITP